MVATASTAPAAPSRWPIIDLVELILRLLGEGKGDTMRVGCGLGWGTGNRLSLGLFELILSELSCRAVDDMVFGSHTQVVQRTAVPKRALMAAAVRPHGRTGCSFQPTQNVRQWQARCSAMSASGSAIA